ncbi:ROK family protein [Rhizobium halophytocola]|uniref:N-acetylglucosamine kinase n=1 Tax=Rhizobium halophytocola TaxID=735519 RepID=A0ABS4E4Z8_9HYPH|nr:N-acetylglucosamine kinase [Rhizobium halophytocola]
MISCFDIGGTAIKGAFARSADDIRTFERRPTPLQDFNAFVETLKSVIAESGETPRCVALSIAGVVDPDTKRAIVANIPSVHGRTLAGDLQAALGLPVIVANDADCFATAEALAGAGKGHRIVFGTILGTGVGGGLVVDGQPINSDGGFGGEWGHGPVAATRAGNPPVELPRFACGCGLHGCIDATCSARGIEKIHAHLHGQTLKAEDILARWQVGDEAAARTVHVMVDVLASPLALVVNVTGATIVPVGGGLSNVPALIARIDEAVRPRILRRFDRPLVVPALCRVEPGLIGAALLGLRSLGEATP